MRESTACIRFKRELETSSLTGTSVAAASAGQAVVAVELAVGEPWPVTGGVGLTQGPGVAAEPCCKEQDAGVDGKARGEGPGVPVPVPGEGTERWIGCSGASGLDRKRGEPLATLCATTAATVDCGVLQLLQLLPSRGLSVVLRRDSTLADGPRGVGQADNTCCCSNSCCCCCCCSCCRSRRSMRLRTLRDESRTCSRNLRVRLASSKCKGSRVYIR